MVSRKQEETKHKNINKWINQKKGGKQANEIKEGLCSGDVQLSKQLTVNTFSQVHDINKFSVNSTHEEIQPRFFVASFSIIEPEAVSSLPPYMARVVTHCVILSVKYIIFNYKKLWGFIIDEYYNNRVS